MFIIEFGKYKFTILRQKQSFSQRKPGKITKIRILQPNIYSIFILVYNQERFTQIGSFGTCDIQTIFLKESLAGTKKCPCLEN